MYSTFYWKICGCVFDNIFVYGHNSYKHVEHLRRVIETLHQEKLYMNSKKCSWIVFKLIFLRYVESKDGV